MRVKIPISGFVMIAGWVSTCEQGTSFFQLQMSLLHPRTVKKEKRKMEKGRMSEDSQSFCHEGILLSLKGILMLDEGMLLLLACSLQPHPEVQAQIKLALCKRLYRDIVRDGSCTEELIGQINRADK